MSQIKNNGALPEVTVTNASQTVILHGYNAVSELVAERSFHVQGEADGYEVSSATPAWDGTNTTFYLTGVYGGTTKGGLGSGVYGLIAKGYTVPDNIIEMDVGDVDTAFIVTRGFRKIQDIFTAIVNGTKELTNAWITGFKDPATTRAALGVAIGADVAAYVKHNAAGSRAPTVNDDSTQGWSFRSTWVDDSVSPSNLLFCLSAATGAAVWIDELTLNELGSMAVQDASNVNMSGGTSSGVTHTASPIKSSPVEATTLSNKPPTTSGIPYTVTLGISALETGRVYRINLHTANTDIAPTLAADGLPAVTIKTADGESIVEGLLYAGIHDFLYDGTDFLVVGFKPALLRREVVSGGAVTSIDFTGLDLNKHLNYTVKAKIKNATASTGNIQAFINNDTTATNYYMQQVYNSSPTLAAANQANTSAIMPIAANTESSGTANIAITGGYVHMDAESSSRRTTSLTKSLRAVKKTATVTNVTQITFTSNVASAIDDDSVIEIYRGDV